VRLRVPSTDFAILSERLGHAWGVTCGEPLEQYLAWSERAGIFALAHHSGTVTRAGIESATVLCGAGVDALVAILASLDVLQPIGDGRYRLSELAREYLLPESPYYVGAGLYWGYDKPLPDAFVKAPTGQSAISPPPVWPIPLRLRIQHSRNFASSVVAVGQAALDGVHHVVDIGGGSGVFAIPLALACPRLRVTLVERAEALPAIRAMLHEYGVLERVALVGMDVFADPWLFDGCDAIVLGNFFHASDNQECRCLATKSYEALVPGGQIWVHEVLLDESRDGPLLAALWNANMAVRKQGARQRTASELAGVLAAAGFGGCRVSPTRAGFSLLTATKPHAPGTPATGRTLADNGALEHGAHS
jgi:acetylserotonin N-methyltransferase